MRPVTNPDLASTFEQARRDTSLSINCHRIGIIQSFDANNQTATIQLVDKKIISTYEGTFLKDYTPLIACPVMIVSGGNGWNDLPITAGDECLVLFNDRNIDNWYSTGQVQAPDNTRIHDLQDGLAIVGFHSKQKRIANFDPTALGPHREDARLQIDSDLKIDISNSTQDLRGLIESFITIIKNLKAQNGAFLYPIDAATSAALDNLTTEFGELLK